MMCMSEWERKLKMERRQTGSEEERTHGAGLADAVGVDRGGHVLPSQLPWKPKFFVEREPELG